MKPRCLWLLLLSCLFCPLTLWAQDGDDPFGGEDPMDASLEGFDFDDDPFARDDPFREAPENESDTDLLHGVLLRMRKMETQLQKSDVGSPDAIDAVSQKQTEIVDRVTRLVLRLQQQQQNPSSGGGASDSGEEESSSKSDSQGGQDQKRSQRQQEDEQRKQQENPEDGQQKGKQEGQQESSAPKPEAGSQDHAGAGADGAYRSRFRSYFQPPESPEAEGRRWGFLPETLRQDLQRGLELPFHPRYRGQITRYYKRIEALSREAEKQEGADAYR